MTGSGDGVHILTGPIAVEGAEPGDVLKVEILDLWPRLNIRGESYGVNAAAWWGFHYGVNGGMEGKAASEKRLKIFRLYHRDTIPCLCCTTDCSESVTLAECGRTSFWA